MCHDNEQVDKNCGKLPKPLVSIQWQGSCAAQDVPPLEIMDDILGIQKCGATSVALNSTVNSFFEVEKLTLSKSKSHVIHAGENSENCCELKVHNEKMDLSDEEKYLGDVIDKTGKPR